MQKQQKIESLRGLAILLVVIGHVIGSAPDGGMKIDFPSPWRYLYLWIDYIQMPLFTAIAGWVYALKPVQTETSAPFITKKVFRVLLPMAIAATLYFLVQYAIPGTNNKGNLIDIWKIYLFPYTLYWYLPSLFIMFVLVVIIDTNKWSNNLSKWIICLLTSYGGLIAIHNIIPDSVPNLFSFKGALSQFPYFMVGLGINRFSNELFSARFKWSYMLLATIGLILLQFEWFFPLSKNSFYEAAQPIWVISLLFILLHQSYSIRFFVWLGSYAYIIYLYHGFGTSGGRIILHHLGINAELLVILFATCIAIFIPIILNHIAKRWNFLQFLLLGQK